eukprot:TRINITY_DN17285_c0_g1_i1.p1 TRINITY_DN17285_c0_g1~~TRINITY_DN17285_c0_g1_i1.p1  ORF type:complete len:194 (-),score=47.31 TRINITY_DN17285_c0_g1_i1:152-733(-)
MTTKASGKFRNNLERGLLGKSDSILILPRDNKSILVPKPMHLNSMLTNDLRTSSKRSALSIGFSSDNNKNNGLDFSESKRRVFSNTFDDECTRQVCDEIQNIIQSEIPYEGINSLNFNVLDSFTSDIDFFEYSITDERDVSAYSVAPPSRASNPVVANSAFSEERLENEGAELGIFSISPPSRSSISSFWDTN